MYRDVFGFVEDVASASAEIGSLFREHIADQGELLPHVLMGDICRLVVATAVVAGSCPVWLTRLLQQLDSGLASGVDEVAELIGVSFVENLCDENHVIDVLRPWMGEALRREVKAICGG